jgi:hypothetical protein
VQQGVATIAWSAFQAGKELSVPMSKGAVPSVDGDSGECVRVEPVLKLRATGVADGGGALAAATKQFNTRLVDAASEADRELHAAAEAGDLDTVKALLPQATSVCVLHPRRGGDLRHDTVQTPLHRAAARGHVAVVEYLLESGARPDANVESGGGGKTALYMAAENGRLAAVKALVAGGATDVKSNSGKRCSQAAAGNADIVQAIRTGRR